MDIDYGFLRLSDTFAKAKDIGDPVNYNRSLSYRNQVHLLPTEKYLQITNSPIDIAFDGDYLVEIIDECENVKADITAYIGITEITDKYGIQQLAFEIAPLLMEFNGILHLRFTHTTGLEIWYSTPFVLSSNNAHLTSRFDYKGYGYFNGFSYDRLDLMQSIRLRCFYDKPANMIEVDSYNQITRHRTVSSRSRMYPKSDYKIVYLNPFVTDALQILLTHDIIYINGVRITDKPILEHGERLGDSNLIYGNFTASIDKTDTYTAAFQIITPFALVNKAPTGNYTLITLPTTISGAFNKQITLASGMIKLFDYNGGFIQTFSPSDIIVTGNSFSVDMTGLVTANGYYFIEMTAGLFTAGTEVSSAETWDFTVSAGDWLAGDWNSADWFTN